MTGMDASAHGSMPDNLAWIWFSLVGALALLYAFAAIGIWMKGHSWPWPRSLCWYGGLALITVATSGSLADRAHGDFRIHMVAHLLLGMLAPLLLVAAMPVTVVLRGLPVSLARGLVHGLRSRPSRLLVHPVTAAMLDMGGLWVLYTTSLFPEMHRHAWLDVGIHVHILAAGYLFTAAMITTDPMPHRPGRVVRLVTLVGALAAHAILAKYLYRHPPAGVSLDQAREAGLLMYYGGDAIDAVLIIAFCRQWLAPDHHGRQSPGTRATAIVPPASLREKRT
jgi:putative membrane protein